MKKDFEKLRNEIQKNDEIREKIILASRIIIKDSKQAIYSIHRNELKQAKQLIEKAEKELKKLKEHGKKVGAYNAALQEYAEAFTYYNYVKSGKLVLPDIDSENFLLGVCDLTGELSRRAVFSVVNEDYKEVKKIKDFVSEIYDEFLKFDLRNGELRKKSDSIKWNLKKIEEILYDLKIRDKL